MSTLRLEIGGLTLSLGMRGVSPFAESAFPRERIDGPSLKYSVRGTPAEEGTAYESKHIWQIEVALKQPDLDKLNLMYDYFLLVRPRTEIAVHDYVSKISEPSPRTRRLATGATSSALSSPVGWITYHATFNARFTQPPKASEEGIWRRVSLQLQETTKTAP